MRYYLLPIGLALALAAMPVGQAGEEQIKVLFVGGDWKAQLPNYGGTTPLRGFFVKQEVEKAFPGRFAFTLWTSYQFLHYGDAESLKAYDVIVVGDIMGQSVLPRLVSAVNDFVAKGGGFWYCDNHKAFSFNTKDLSFDEVLPIEVVPFRPYGPEPCQPRVSGEPFKPQIVAPTHPILNGLDVAAAPALRPGAAYGKVKEGATVLARSPDGKDIWVAWQKGRGRCLWTGGVFANDEISEDFAKWEGFGKFYGQALAWLGEARAGARKPIAKATAEATLTVDLKKKLPTVTAKHFGIHGQEDAPGGSYPMKDADLALYEALNLAGTFARTSAFAGIKRKPGGNEQDLLDDGTDLTTFDREKYDFKNADIVLADLERIKAEPIFLYWCPWWGPNWPDPARYTKYFAASIEHVNGPPGAASRPRLKYFEIMNEPHLGPANEVLPRYAEFFNHAVEKLRNRYGKEIKFGCGGFYEWTYVQAIIDRCGKNLDWLSRHPYGHTGEAVFYLQDKYQEYAQSKGIPDLKFIITEWDFWIYGEPAFDYIMMRWKPLLDRADSCLGTLHYRWREYHEGGYVFGLHGEFDQRYGELPPEWPNPGKDKPITYRYNAFWIMRHCRGQQYEVKVESPQLGAAVIPGREEYKARLSDPLASASHLYAVAAADGDKYNIVVYYGYPRENPLTGQCLTAIKLRVRSPLPPEVKGRQLIVARADCRRCAEEAPRPLAGDEIDLEVELPALTALSLTVR